jgi:hypothetical protein
MAFRPPASVNSWRSGDCFRHIPRNINGLTLEKIKPSALPFFFDCLCPLKGEELPRWRMSIPQAMSALAAFKSHRHAPQSRDAALNLPHTCDYRIGQRCWPLVPHWRTQSASAGPIPLLRVTLSASPSLERETVPPVQVIEASVSPEPQVRVQPLPPSRHEKLTRLPLLGRVRLVVRADLRPVSALVALQRLILLPAPGDPVRLDPL